MFITAYLKTVNRLNNHPAILGELIGVLQERATLRGPPHGIF
jgi:hypothetical protein